MDHASATWDLATRLELPQIIRRCSGSESTGAEVGVWRGKFSEFLLSNVEFSSFYCIDAWRHLPDHVDVSNVSDAEHEANFVATQQRLERFGPQVRIVRRKSADAARLLPDGGVDFIYIDGDHSYRGCRDDLEVYYQKVKSGGILAGHDYLDGSLPEGEFGVKKAVDEFVCRTHPAAFFFSRELWPSWVLIK